MTLVMREGHPPFLADENGHLSMRDGERNWLVIVTREALENAAAPADGSLLRLTAFLPLFVDVANFKLEHGRTGEEETIWIQSDDLREWRFHHSD